MSEKVELKTVELGGKFQGHLFDIEKMQYRGCEDLTMVTVAIVYQKL